MQLADGLDEALVVLVAHPLDVPVVVLDAVTQTLKEVLLLLPIIECPEWEMQLLKLVTIHHT